MELKNRKISRKFCFYAIILLSVIFQTKSGCSPIQIWFIYHSWKFESCSFNRGRVTALYVSKNDKSEVHWSEIPEQAAVQHDQIMHTAYIGELNAMHFKQTLNKITNLPQEHSNYTSCHDRVMSIRCKHCKAGIGLLILERTQKITDRKQVVCKVVDHN